MLTSVPVHFVLLLVLILAFHRGQAVESSSLISTEVFVKASDDYNNIEISADEKRRTVDHILNLLDQNPDFPYRHYWRAVFLTFQCEIQDKGRWIPRCIISELSHIKDMLNQAHQNYPAYHHYAPARTLGIMYFKMPAIVGGSNNKALRYLIEAQEGAPDFEENKRWLETVKKEM